MANRPSRVTMSVYAASADGRFYPRYPYGNAPSSAAALQAIAAAIASASCTTILTGAGFSAVATAPVTAGASLTTIPAPNAMSALGLAVSSALGTLTTITAPSAPTILTATVTANGVVQVTFLPSAFNGGAAITGYTAVSSPGGFTGSCPPSANGIGVSGLSTTQAYTFAVTATNSAGIISATSAQSNSVTPFIGNTLPNAPTGFTMTGQGQNSVSLAWTAPAVTSFAIASYNIRRNGNSAVYANVTGTTYTDSAATDTNMPNLGGGNPDPNTSVGPGTGYTYTVTAVDTQGNESAPQTALRQNVYQNGTWNWAGDYSYNAVATYNDTSGNPQGGVGDIKIQVTAANGQWQPYAGNITSLWDDQVGAFDHITLDLKPTAANQDWTLDIVNRQASTTGDVFPVAKVKLSSYGTIAQGQWSRFPIPLADLRIGITQFAGTIGAPYGTVNVGSATYNTATLTSTSVISGPGCDCGGFITGAGIPVGTYIYSANGGSQNGPWIVAGPNVTGSTSANGVLTCTRTDIYKFSLIDQTGLASNTYYVDNVAFTSAGQPAFVPIADQQFVNNDTPQGASNPPNTPIQTSTTAFPNKVRAGDSIVFWHTVATYEAAHSVINISDTEKNSYSLVEEIINPTANQGATTFYSQQMEMFFALNAAGDTSTPNVVTIGTPDGDDDYQATAGIEVSGVQSLVGSSQNNQLGPVVNGQPTGLKGVGVLNSGTGIVVTAAMLPCKAYVNCFNQSAVGTTPCPSINAASAAIGWTPYKQIWGFETGSSTALIAELNINAPGTYQFIGDTNSSANETYMTQMIVLSQVPKSVWGGGRQTHAAAFLSFAADMKSQGKILIGQHTQYFEGNTNSESQAYTSVTPLYTLTSKLPAMIGVTANWYGTSDPYNSSGGGQPSLNVVSQIIKDWCSTSSNTYKPLPGAGVVMCNWGVPSPIDGSTAPAISSSQFAQVCTPGTAYNNTMLSSAQKLQTWLLSVVAANPNVVLILRLFIELNITQQWYGVQNSQSDVNNQIALFRQMFTAIFSGAAASLRNNVLVCYNGNGWGGMGAAAAWPGKAYADLAGLDVYDQHWSGGNASIQPGQLALFEGFGVPIGLCECGIDDGQSNPTSNPINSVSNLLIPNWIKSSGSGMVFYCQWNDNENNSQNGGSSLPSGKDGSMSICLQNDASTLMNESYSVTLSSLPAF